jgi:hypothetical protein
VFDGDLIFDKFNPLHRQAQNLLFGFKAWILDRGADITTKLVHRRDQIGLALLFLLLFFEIRDS